MTIGSDFESGVDTIMAQLGSDMHLVDTKGVSTPIRAVITNVGKDDGELINAIGIEARIAYLPKETVVPKKFDELRVDVTGDVYTIHDANKLVVDNNVVAIQCIVARVS